MAGFVVSVVLDEEFGFESLDDVEDDEDFEDESADDDDDDDESVDVEVADASAFSALRLSVR